MDAFINDTQLIYDRFADEISKAIFVDRLSYSLTGNLESLRRVIKTIPSGREFLERLDEAVSAGRKICIFGSGIWGKSIFESNPDVKFFCFVDNNIDKCGKELKGIPVIHFNDWIEIKERMTIIIATRLHYKEIYLQLKEHQISNELIINAGRILDEATGIQYFDLPELKNNKTNDEVFVDTGAFDGQTSAMFVQWAEKYRKIFALEPEPKNREKCQERLKAIGAKYEILPFGAWDKRERLSFATGLNGGSHVSDSVYKEAEKRITIDADRLDNLIYERVSFIKMDIEGAEINALRGAEKTIKKYRPKLAISVYHRKEDIWEIPKLILSYVPEYKLYLRHYSPFRDETVLYCIPQ